MHYLHLIPSSSWNNGTVRDAIYSLYRDVQQNGGYRYCSERYEQQFLYETSVMLLSFRDKPRISDFGKN